MEDQNSDVFLAALADVAKARSIAQLAKDTGLRWESLYKTLTPGAKPRFDTIMKIAKTLGVLSRSKAIMHIPVRGLKNYPNKSRGRLTVFMV